MLADIFASFERARGRRITSADIEHDPTRVNTIVDVLGESVFDCGPSDKMIARAKSIAASYAANGRSRVERNATQS